MWKKNRKLKSKTIQIDHVGNVLLDESIKAKRLSISIKPFKGVRVAVPVGISFKYAEQFSREKIEWIRKHLLKMKILEQEHNDRLKVTHLIDRRKAKHILVQRLNHLSNRFGFTYNKVFIRNQKTRWGSCSAKNNINLNMNLVRLPERLIDYTILHELVHTRIKNHSKIFWDELTRIVEDAKKRDKELNRYII